MDTRTRTGPLDLEAIKARAASIGGQFDYLDKAGTVEQVLEEDIPALIAEIERLRAAAMAACLCLNYVGPLNEYEHYARDILADAVGPDTVITMRPPLEVTRAILGEDYPFDGWEDGKRPEYIAQGTAGQLAPRSGD